MEDDLALMQKKGEIHVYKDSSNTDRKWILKLCV